MNSYRPPSRTSYSGYSTKEGRQLDRDGRRAAILGTELAIGAEYPWHPEAAAFCTNALNRHAGVNRNGKQKPWNFHHIDGRGRVVQPSGLVVTRHHKDPMRLPSWAYS